MNELKNRIEALKQKLSDNIENQYATTYEESEIAEVDNSVINEVSNYLEYINTMKNKAIALKGVADTFNYKNTSSDLSGLSKSISDYEINHSDMPEEILKASKEGFEELADDFDSCKGAIDDCIDRAEQNYNNAITYKNKRDSYDTDSEEKRYYYHYNDLYHGQLKKGNSECSTAETFYETLINMFNSGLKKTSTVVSIDDSLGEEENSFQPEGTYVENVLIDENILRFLDILVPKCVVFTGTVNANGFPIEGTFDDGDQINCSFYENGQLSKITITHTKFDNYVERTYDENEKLEKETNVFYDTDRENISYIHEITYDNGVTSSLTTTEYYEGGKNIHATFEGTYDNGEISSSIIKTYCRDGKPYAIEKEKYDNGVRTESQGKYFCSDGKTISGTFERTYDNNSVRETGTGYVTDGTLSSTYERTTYDDNSVRETCTFYRSNGEIWYTSVVTCDAEGNVTSRENFNPDGTPKID